MDRRSFLKAVGVTAGTLGAGGLLAACARGGGGIPGGDPTLSVLNTSFETLVGDSRRLNLVVYDNQLGSLAGADVSLFLRDLEGEVISGPHEGSYQGEVGDGTGGGVYQAVLPLTEPGAVEVVVVEGDRYGLAAINVIGPEQAQAPVPGDAAIVTATPTPEDDLGFAFLCTDDPPCPMHDVSLDAALGQGRPVALLFATPQYCQTAVCGPAVTHLAELRDDRDWDDIAFIHCEIYSDEQAATDIVVSDPVREWGLPTEPWLFAIDADGAIVDRLDGLILPSDMTRLLEQLA